MYMKRLFSLAMALMMALSLASVSFAATQPTAGNFYEPDEDDNRYVNVDVSNLAPGRTYYLAISDARLSSSKPATKASARNVTVERNDENSRKATMIGSSLNVVRRRYGSGSTDWFWYIEVPIKNASLSDYPEDGYLATGYFTVGNESFDISTDIKYPDGGSEIEKNPQFFLFDDTYDEELYLPDGDSSVIIDSKGVKSKLLLAMTTDYNDTIASKYPSANIDFFNGNGASFKKTATMRISGNTGDYLYELKDGTLTDLSRNWDKSEDAFVFKTRTLGTYMRSDRKLDGAAIGGTTSSSSSAASSSNSGSSGNVSNDALSNIISGAFSNKFTVIAYGDKYENIGSTVTLKCQLDLSGFNTKTLVVYAYDEVNNRLIALNNAGASVDATGNMLFKTAVKGRYVITDSPLKAK